MLRNTICVSESTQLKATVGHSPEQANLWKGACQAKTCYVWKVGHQEATAGYMKQYEQKKKKTWKGNIYHITEPVVLL